MRSLAETMLSAVVTVVVLAGELVAVELAAVDFVEVDLVAVGFVGKCPAEGLEMATERRMGVSQLRLNYCAALKWDAAQKSV